jgi:hypothetical protein
MTAGSRFFAWTVSNAGLAEGSVDGWLGPCSIALAAASFGGS